MVIVLTTAEHFNQPPGNALCCAVHLNAWNCNSQAMGIMKRGIPGTDLASALPVDMQHVPPKAALAKNDANAYLSHEQSAMAHSATLDMHTQQFGQAGSVAHMPATGFVSSPARRAHNLDAAAVESPSCSTSSRQQAVPLYNYAAYEDDPHSEREPFASTAPTAPGYSEAGFSSVSSAYELQSSQAQMRSPGGRTTPYAAPEVAIRPPRHSRQAEQRCTLATPLYGHEHSAKPFRSPPLPNVVVTRAPQALVRAPENAWRR